MYLTKIPTTLQCIYFQMCFIDLLLLSVTYLCNLSGPSPSGTRVEGPAGRGGGGRSPGRRGTAASGLLWGSGVEVSVSRPD